MQHLDTFDPTAEDGHPCETALEFRKAIVRLDIAREVPADALDLAIAFAWIGKAVSRTKTLKRWKMNGIDPNTYEFIQGLSLNHQMRTTGLKDALEGEAATGRSEELKGLRKLRGFQQAVATLKVLTAPNVVSSEVNRLSVLARLAEQFPGPKNARIQPIDTGNVILFPSRNQKMEKKTPANRRK